MGSVVALLALAIPVASISVSPDAFIIPMIPA